jgi:hypothetical protein
LLIIFKLGKKNYRSTEAEHSEKEKNGEDKGGCIQFLIYLTY